MRFLNLILYSETDPVYTQMRDILRKYLETLANVDHYFYCYSTKYAEPYTIAGDMIYIHGTETFIPGILTKTIETLRIFQHREEYDYIVRTNISTVCNFSLLQAHLEKTPQFDYGGGITSIVQYEPSYGVTDKSLLGLSYVSGTCILLSKRAVSLLFEKIHSLNYSVIDDVAIGDLFRNIGVTYSYLNNYYVSNQNVGNNTSILYRNRHPYRQEDIKNMRRILESIQNPTYPQYPSYGT
jgi:hypothetical protein